MTHLFDPNLGASFGYPLYPEMTPPYALRNIKAHFRGNIFALIYPATPNRVNARYAHGEGTVCARYAHGEGTVKAR